MAKMKLKYMFLVEISLLALLSMGAVSHAFSQNILPIRIHVNWTPPIRAIELNDEKYNYAGFTRLDGPSGIPVITYNPALYSKLPQAALVFMRVHEYGHAVLRTSDEARCDCWAGKQLAVSDPSILNDAISFFVNIMGNTGGDMTHGNGFQMAENVKSCALTEEANLKIDPIHHLPNETINQENRPKEIVNVDEKFYPPPKITPKVYGGIINDTNAINDIDYDLDYSWSKKASHPYCNYVITLKNTGTNTIDCIAIFKINLNSRKTRETLIPAWNFKYHKLQIKPNKTKEIKDEIQWYSDREVMPGIGFELKAMYSN